MEIIHQICVEFDKTTPPRRGSAEYNPGRPKEFGRASLVNRLWAKHLRPRIFDAVYIKSHDDAREFIDLCRSSASFWINKELDHIGALFTRIDLEQRHDDCLWIHNITSLIPRSMFPALDKLNVEINVSRSTHWQLPKTIYHHLPRTLPPMKVDQ